MLTLILVALILAFIAYEVVAHFVMHNVGMETLSHVIADFEKKCGLPARILVVCACIALLVHLEGGF